jgi:hypothetical protein
MIAFLAGLPWGIRGVAATYVVVTGVLLVPMLRSALALIGMPLAAYLKNLAPVLAITLGMAASVLAWRWAMAAAGVRQLHWMLGSSVAVGIGSYCALALWAWPPAVRNLFELLRSADVGVVKGLAQRVVEVRARPA